MTGLKDDKTKYQETLLIIPSSLIQSSATLRLLHHQAGDSFYYVDLKIIQYGYQSHSRMKQGKLLAVMVIFSLD
jgi:hypothetical protein